MVLLVLGRCPPNAHTRHVQVVGVHSKILQPSTAAGRRVEENDLCEIVVCHLVENEKGF